MRLPAGESPSFLEERHPLLPERNCRSCFRGRAPANNLAVPVLARRHAILPDTAARTQRCRPDRSALAPSRKPPAPKAKSQWGSNTSFAAATALPGSTASFFPSRSPPPPPESATAAGPQSWPHIFPAAAHPRAAARTPATRKWSRTAPSPPRRTNILKEVLAVHVS